MNFALIGCGKHGSKIESIIRKAKDAEVVAVVDPELKIAYNDMDEIKVDYDAVWIASPNDTHAELAIRAARAGKHIVCEKPMSSHLVKCQEMVDEAAENKVSLTVTHTLRYNYEFRKARELIKTGKIGEVVGVHVSVMLDRPREGWKAKESCGGGVLLMNAIHMIDIVPFVTGLMPTTCSAQVHCFESKAMEDTASVLYRLSNGAPCVVEASSICRASSSLFTMSIRGTKGIIDIVPHFIDWYVNGDHWSEDFNGTPDSRVVFVERFVESVKKGKAPPITGEDGFSAVLMVQAAYHSAKVGRVKKMVSV